MIIISFILGAILGSFVKALADRSLKDKSFWGRSYCPKCQKTLRWYDLFPILSYLSTLGRCRYCQKTIGAEYLVVEVVMGILVGYLFWQNSTSFQIPDSRFQFLISFFDLIFKTFFITILAVVFLTDLKEMLIPDRVILPGIVIAFSALIVETVYKIGYLYLYLSNDPVGKYLLPPESDYFLRHALTISEPLYLGVLSAMLIGGFFLSLIIITKGKGMGGGDVKLGALMGLALGFPQAFLSLMLSFLTGAVFSIILVIFGKKGFKSSIAFGPFLVVGSLIALFWGEKIVDWYLKMT